MPCAASRRSRIVRCAPRTGHKSDRSSRSLRGRRLYGIDLLPRLMELWPRVARDADRAGGRCGAHRLGWGQSRGCARIFAVPGAMSRCGTRSVTSDCRSAFRAATRRPTSRRRMRSGQQSRVSCFVAMKTGSSLSRCVGARCRSSTRGPLKAWKAATFNAKAETVKTLASFREPFKKRRCLIAAEGWVEWKGEGKPKPKFYIEPRGGEPICLAGL